METIITKVKKKDKTIVSIIQHLSRYMGILEETRGKLSLLVMVILKIKLVLIITGKVYDNECEK